MDFQERYRLDAASIRRALREAARQAELIKDRGGIVPYMIGPVRNDQQRKEAGNE